MGRSKPYLKITVEPIELDIGQRVRFMHPENIPPEVVAELRQMVAQGQKIHAIKRLRELTSCGLAEAKELVERL